MNTLSLMSLPKRVVIVGYGPVGHILLEHLVEGTEVALEITVICEEPRLAYNRVAMTSYFQHRSPEELAMASLEWLEEKNVQLIFARATCIKRAQKRVVYEGANVSGEMEYDELVLATGSSPFVPPLAGLKTSTPGIFVYRTIEDMDAIIARAATSRRAAVIGGGLLGLEAAKALLDLQMNVSVLEVAPFLMSAQLDQVAGELLEKRLSKLGLSIHTAVELQEVLCNQGVRFVRLKKNGVESFLEVDLLIISCGIRPRDELARNCQLDLGERGGVKVDCCLRSSDPTIYAVGEVASYEGGMVYGLWKPGAEQAEVLAATLGSPSAGLRYHGSDLSTKLKLLGVNVASFGANAEFWKHRMYDFQDGQAGICVQSTLDSGRYRKLVFRRLPGGSRRLLGGILVESVEDYQSLCDLARCGRELWGLETVVMTHGPRANPGQIEDMVYPKHLPTTPGMLEMGTALRVVIVGHGPVGNTLIENLLEERERNVAITVLCEEPRLAYNRVAMTSYFQHRSAAELSMVNMEWLQEKNVQLIFARATSIKRSHKRVTYQGPNTSGELEYDELVLATGSSPFVPPISGLKTSIPGIFLYRTIEDMDAIIARAQTSRRAAVLGGGLLGLEAAKALMELGMETHIIESAPHLMPSQLDTVAGDLLKCQVESLGCVVHVKVEISEIFSDETGVQAMRFLQDGAPFHLDLDLLIVSCGIRPRDDLARACDLELGQRGGIKVDGCLRTSDPNIYAVGEVASHDGMVYGLWKPGSEQAEVLAATLGSPSAGLRYHGSDLSTKLKLLGVNVASFGESAAFWQGRTYQLLRDDEKPPMCVRSVLDASSGTYRKLIFKRMPGGSRKLLGGILINSLDDYHSLCDIARCGKELWGLEPMVLVEGPRVTPGRLEQSFPQARL
ncbi:unnamed protein product [Cladocopium goreaui]|uniref:Nitrite reductase (NADH) large subunit n=1 Tax=Cladocopium goreaui TaxID=2562237 RepID=A0A9P1BJE4_9DINO|nr:unnamed protein product [Cladocopium goreaui]